MYLRRIRPYRHTITSFALSFWTATDIWMRKTFTAGRQPPPAACEAQARVDFPPSIRSYPPRRCPNLACPHLAALWGEIVIPAIRAESSRRSAQPVQPLLPLPATRLEDPSRQSTAAGGSVPACNLRHATVPEYASPLLPLVSGIVVRSAPFKVFRFGVTGCTRGQKHGNCIHRSPRQRSHR